MKAIQNFLLALAHRPSLRWPVLLLLIVPAAFGATRLAISTDQNIFFGENNPEYLDYQHLEDSFGSDQSIVFVIKSNDGSIFTRDNLQSLYALTERAWTIPNVRKVNSLTNFQHSFANGDDIFVAPLIDEVVTLDAAQTARIEAVARDEPLINGLLISPPGDAAAVILTLDYSPDDPEAVPAIMERALTLKEETLAGNTDLQIGLTGSAPLSQAFQEASLEDGAVLFPITIAIVIVGFFIMWRSVGAAIAPIVIVVAASASTMGFAGWLGFPITPLLSIVPVLLLTIGVADLVHLNNGFVRFSRAGSLDDAVAQSYRHNIQPILITTISTAAGFFSFTFADSPPLRQFGIVATFGVAVTMVIALLAYAPILKACKASIKSLPLNLNIWEPWSRFVKSRPAIILLAGLALIGMMGFVGLPRITLDDRFDNYFDETFEARRDMEFARDNLIGVYAVEFLIDTQIENGIFIVDNLEAIDQFSQWLSREESVGHVSSYTHILKKLNKNFHNDDPAYYTLPLTQEEAAQYFLVYSMSLPAGNDMNDIVNLDKSSVRITATTPTASAVEIRNLKKRAENWPSVEIAAFEVSAVGTGVMTAFMSQRNIESMAVGTLIIITIISVILLLTFRSFRLAAMGLASNLLPIVVGFSLWGALIGNIGMAASIIAALSIGLIVDDTVHFLTRYTERQSAMPRLLYAFESAGVAIVQTSIILLLGFFVLTFSGFLINYTIGVLMVVIIVAALFVDLLVLPALLELTRAKKNDIHR